MDKDTSNWVMVRTERLLGSREVLLQALISISGCEDEIVLFTSGLERPFPLTGFVAFNFACAGPRGDGREIVDEAAMVNIISVINSIVLGNYFLGKVILYYPPTRAVFLHQMRSIDAHIILECADGLLYRNR